MTPGEMSGTRRAAQSWFFAATAVLGAACGSAPTRSLRSAATQENGQDNFGETGPAEMDSYVAGSAGHEEMPPIEERDPHPLVDKTDAELETLLLENPSALGSASLGRASSGALFGGIQMPNGPLWQINNPSETWGTIETTQFIATAIEAVNKQFPDTLPIHIGDIGSRNGGYLFPHASHQSGRDVDLGYYYLTPSKWYTTATLDNLDLPRTWALIKATVFHTDVEAIFIDTSIQRLLRCHATAIGEDPAWLDQIFGGPTTNLRPLILHEKGHRTHLHVRYHNPVAQETGRRIHSALLRHELIKPPTYYVHYKAKRGDTLGKIASKFNTNIATLKRANGLKNSRIYAKRSYKIPRRGGVAQLTDPVPTPRRRVPGAYPAMTLAADDTVPLPTRAECPAHAETSSSHSEDGAVAAPAQL